MIWDSVTAMTAIDIIIIALVIVAIPQLRRSDKSSASPWGMRLVLTGLMLVGGFYVVDLYVMWIMPLHAGHAESMIVMEALHLNSRWVVTLLSFPCLVIGFISMRAALDQSIEKSAADNKRVNQLLQALPDGLLIVDTDGTISQIGGSVEALFDAPRALLVGLPVARLFQDFDADPRSPGDHKLVGLTLKGASFPAEVRIAELVNHQMLLLVRNTAERELLETQFRESQKLESLGRLASGIAHDFNNYLTVIMGEAELVQLDSSAAERSGKRVYEAASGAAGLTNQLLSFSRKQILNPKVTDINRVIEDMRELIVNAMSERISLDIVLADELAPVRVDRPALEQAILNLAINARDAMPAGGVLVIETGNCYLDESYVDTHPEAATGKHAMITIRDSGSGMSKEVLDRAFEPFFTTKPRGRGTGLGLAMVTGFVSQSQGSVAMESRPAEGTTVRIYLPSVEEALEEETVNTTCNITRAAERGTILVAEDAEGVREFVTDALSRYGYEVRCFADTPQALANIDDSVDLLLTDIILPSGSGIDLAAQAEEKLPGLPVLYMTGYAEDTIALAGRLEAGVRLLRKPFSVQDLLDAIRATLAAAPPAPAAPAANQN